MIPTTLTAIYIAKHRSPSIVNICDLEFDGLLKIVGLNGKVQCQSIDVAGALVQGLDYPIDVDMGM